jgi:translation initiation factor SUI1
LLTDYSFFSIFFSRRILDPFADEIDPLGGNQDVGSQQNYIHIRIQQRNGRKTLTTLQGLPKGAHSKPPLQCGSALPHHRNS